MQKHERMYGGLACMRPRAGAVHLLPPRAYDGRCISDLQVLARALFRVWVVGYGAVGRVFWVLGSSTMMERWRDGHAIELDGDGGRDGT